MINIQKNEIELIQLTPEGAKQYLQKKPKYLAIWNKLIPNYFTAKDFSNLINQMRTKRIEKVQQIDQEITKLQQKEKNGEFTEQDKKRLQLFQEQKKAIFIDTRNQIFNPFLSSRLKNANIRYTEVNQLIGSLAGSLKTPKEVIHEFTEIVNQEILNDLSEIEVYEDEFSTLVESLVDQYFTSKGIGTINEGEIREFGEKARSIFLAKHKEKIIKDKIDEQKLYTYFHRKNLI